MLFLNLLIIFSGLVIAYEDFTSRSVHLLALVFFGLFLIIKSLLSIAFATFLVNTTYNLIFISLQLVLLTGFLSLKRKRIINLLNNELGIGDVLLLLSLCFYFSFLNYLIFYVFSLLLVVLSLGVTNLIWRPLIIQIPLAGMQTIIFMIVFFTGWIFPEWRFNDDEWITSYLLKWMQ